jgi:hypothetical protein
MDKLNGVDAFYTACDSMDKAAEFIDCGQVPIVSESGVA